MIKSVGELGPFSRSQENGQDIIMDSIIRVGIQKWKIKLLNNAIFQVLSKEQKSDTKRIVEIACLCILNITCSNYWFKTI